jgi:hypothetical protein
MLAWLMRSKTIIHLLEKWSYDYIKMDCEDGKCYGVLAVSTQRWFVCAIPIVTLGPPDMFLLGTLSPHPKLLSHRRQ